MGKPVKYLGFIQAAKEAEPLLRSLGVKGEMNHRRGNFEMCEIYVEDAYVVVPKLKQLFPSFDTVCFTGVDSYGKPVCGMNIKDYSPAYNYEWREEH